MQGLMGSGKDLNLILNEMGRNQRFELKSDVIWLPCGHQGGKQDSSEEATALIQPDSDGLA